MSGGATGDGALGMSLDRLRGELDAVDDELLVLLNRRHRVCEAVGRWKRAQAHPVVDPSRESEILDRLSAANRGPLPEDSLRAIYGEILRASHEAQRRIVDGPGGAAEDA